MADHQEERDPPGPILEQIKQIYHEHQGSLFRGSREIALAGESSFEELQVALTLTTKLADLALRLGFGSGVVLPDTRASHLIKALRQELAAMDSGVTSHALQPRHAGKTLPVRTHHPLLVRLREHRVAAMELLIEFGFRKKAAKQNVVAALEFVELELWGPETLRKDIRELKRNPAHLEKLKSDILCAVAMDGRETTTVHQVASRMSGKTVNELRDMILGHLMRQAGLANRVLNAAKNATSPKA